MIPASVFPDSGHNVSLVVSSYVVGFEMCLNNNATARNEKLYIHKTVREAKTRNTITDDSQPHIRTITVYWERGFMIGNANK